MCGSLLREKRCCGSRVTTETSFLAPPVFALARRSDRARQCLCGFANNRLSRLVLLCLNQVFGLTCLVGCALRRCVSVVFFFLTLLSVGCLDLACPACPPTSQHGLLRCCAWWVAGLSFRRRCFFLAVFLFVGDCDRHCVHDFADSVLRVCVVSVTDFVAFGQPLFWHRASTLVVCFAQLRTYVCSLPVRSF